MPVFINPARVVIDEGSRAVPVAATGAAVAAAAVGIAAVVTAWWPVILGGAVLAAVVTALSVRALHRRTVMVWDHQVARPPVRAQAVSAPPPYQIPAPKQIPVPGAVLAIESPRSSGQPRQGNRHGE
jgi:hypothetical protein